MSNEILEIKIEGENEGYNNDQKLSPSNFDMSELKELLEHLYNLISSVNKDKQLITYRLKEGSIVNEISAPKEVIEKLNELFYSVKENNSLKGLDDKQSQALSYFQKMSKDKNRVISIKNTLDKTFELNINSYTNYKVHIDKYVETELTLYGIVTYMGGKQNPSIHLDTDEYGLLTIYTKEYVLRQLEKNMLYKEIGIEVYAKQNITNFKLKDIYLKKFNDFYYSNIYNKEALNEKYLKGSKSWKDVQDINKFLSELRGHI